MLRWFRYLAVIVAVLLSSYFVLPGTPVRANINSCYASVTPNQVPPNSNITFQIALHNTDPVNTISWIKVTRPSDNFVINTATIHGWVDSTNANDTTQTGGTLSPDSYLTVYIYTTAADIGASAANWRVQVSDDVGGASPYSCNGGDLSSAIGVPDTTPPTISNVFATNFTTTGATIAWSTDEPATSQVDYGQTDSYGDSTAVDSSLVTQHSVSLGGLAADTGYHYRVVSHDAAGNQAISDDNTFLTPLTNPTTPPPTSSTTPPPTNPIIVPLILPTVIPLSSPTAQGSFNTAIPVKTEIPLKVISTEKVPPIISFNALPDKSYKEAPVISGTASDNEALAEIEYSIDGGKSWLPVNKHQALGTKQVTFEFQPLNLNDGNYPVLARAIDTSGNIGYTPVVNLVIDRLPPIVGGSLMSVGPQVLFPDSSQTITALPGIDQKITLSTTGGPISINLLAKRAGSPTSADNFALIKSADTGLWSGVLGFSKPGNYTLVANALDGAGNKTQRNLANVSVVALPKLLAAGGNGQSRALNGARLSVYYLDSDTNSWVVWDGAPFAQANPQFTRSDGSFRFFLPAGIYYLKAEAKGYRSLVSKRFTLDKPQAITTDLRLSRAPGLHLGSFSLNLPTLWPSLGDLQLAEAAQPAAPRLIGKSLPSFSLPDLSGTDFNSVQLLGKPTLISLFATWSPPSQEQLPALTQLQSNPDIQVLPIAIQEKAQRVAAYTTLAGYKLQMLVDADGFLADKLGLYSLPTHYFLDAKGSIIKVMVGVLSEQQLLEQLSGVPHSGAGLGP